MMSSAIFWGLCICTLVQIVSPQTTTSPVYTCSFENPEDELCGGTQLRNDDFDWSVTSGHTHSKKTGPEGAWDGDYYMYIETSKPRRKNDAAIYVFSDDAFTPLEPDCLKFHYHMYGFHVNKLQVVKITGLESESPDMDVLWEAVQEKGDLWLEAHVTVQLEDEQRLALVGFVGNGIHGDIAVDNIITHSGSCPQDRSVNKLLKPLNMTGITTKILYSSAFEPPMNLNGMVQAREDTFDWTWWSGPTDSLMTGPASAFDGEYFLYIEASRPRRKTDFALAFMPTLNHAGPVCVRFAYNMFGHHINRLDLVRQTVDGELISEWFLEKAQGRPWFVAEVDVELNTEDKIGFRGEVGNGIHGDIAIDSVLVSAGRCGSKIPTTNTTTSTSTTTSKPKTTTTNTTSKPTTTTTTSKPITTEATTTSKPTTTTSTTTTEATTTTTTTPKTTTTAAPKTTTKTIKKIPDDDAPGRPTTKAAKTTTDAPNKPTDDTTDAPSSTTDSPKTTTHIL